MQGERGSVREKLLLFFHSDTGQTSCERTYQLLVHFCYLLVHHVLLAGVPNIKEPQAEERIQDGGRIMRRLLANKVGHDVAQSRAYNGHESESSDCSTEDYSLLISHCQDRGNNEGLVPISLTRIMERLRTRASVKVASSVSMMIDGTMQA